MNSMNPKQARQKLGITQKAMAALMGVHVQTWIKWEHGTRKMNRAAAELLRRIMEELDMKSYQEWMEMSDSQKSLENALRLNAGLEPYQAEGSDFDFVASFVGVPTSRSWHLRGSDF